MKKLSNKAFLEQFYNIYAVEYGDANLEPFEKVAYNAGVYGWNWTAFKVGDRILVQGYRNLPDVEKMSKADAVVFVEKVLTEMRGA